MKNRNEDNVEITIMQLFTKKIIIIIQIRILS